ncbi:MAG: YfhO family protein [Oscillospiraceae bacterium]|nr:YfhO family protein [Oscillospiraceae bacterium]
MSKFKFKPKNPIPAIKSFFGTKEQIWLSFLIPFAVMAGAYIYFKVYPFGEKSVLSLDLNAQYVFYFAYMKDALFGAEDVLYSWSRNLSGEFVGIIGYYLFSPFNLLVWIFPLSHITEGLLLMLMTKIGFIGVTMSVYLSVGRGFRKHTTVLFSIMYALLSYNIVQTMNPMWLDGVMALPLVVMGIEQLLKKGKYKLLVFSLFYSFVTCFYIGYMVAIFSALYFIYYALTSRRLNVKSNLILLLKRAGLFAAVAAISVLLAAFILLPVYSALSMGKFTFSNPDYSIRNSFSIFEITRKLFVNSYDTVRMDGMPFLYAGIMSLILLPAYFLCDRIRRARRFGGVVFIAILIYCMSIVPVDMMWHGGQVPNWLPYRYSFMLCFLMISFASEAFEYIQKIPRKVIGGVATFFCALLVYWESVDTVKPDLGNGRDVFNWFSSVMPSVLLVLIFTGILILAREKLNKHNMVTAVLVALVAMELFFNTQNSIEKQNEDIVYSSRTSFNSVIIPTREVTDRINKQDKTLFRMEKTYIRSACDIMALRMNGSTHSSSMLNDKAIALLKNLGYAARSHMSRYSGHTPLTDDLFGYKYILSCENNNTSNIKSSADITVTENEDVLPIAYLVNPKLLDYTFESTEYEDSVFNNQNKLLSYMLGDEDNQYFVHMNYIDKRPQNLIEEGSAEGMAYKRGDAGGDSHIQYDVIADEDGEYFMYFPTRYERKCNLWIARYDENDETSSGEFLGVVYETDNYHIRSLGHFKKGEKFMMTLSLTGDVNNVYFREENIVRLDIEKLEADIARLREINASTIFKAPTKRKLVITTNNAEEMLLFTSVPIEPGWTARLNGKKIDIMDILPVTAGKDPETNVDIKEGALMGVMMPAGYNTIEFKFFPNRMPLGILLSFVGAGGLVLLWYLIEKRNNMKKIKVNGKLLETAEEDDDYHGFDSDYINIESESEYEDFDFDKASKNGDGEKNASDG